MKIEFSCSVAPLMSAIKIGSDVMRLTLEIPLSEIENAIGVAALQGQPLRATLEVEEGSLTLSNENGDKNSAQVNQRTARPTARVVGG